MVRVTRRPLPRAVLTRALAPAVTGLVAVAVVAVPGAVAATPSPAAPAASSAPSASAASAAPAAEREPAARPTLTRLAVPTLGAVARQKALVPQHAHGEEDGEHDAAGTSKAPAKVAAALSRTGLDFDVLGLTWTGAVPDGSELLVRSHGADRGWGEWTAVEQDEGAPDPGTEEARRARPGSGVVLAPGSDGVEVLLAGTSAAVPADLSVSLVSSPVEAADSAPATTTPTTTTSTTPAGKTGTTGTTTTTTTTTTTASTAAVPTPSIISRAGWGADESLRPCDANPLAGFEAAVVHHTVNANSYTAEQAPSLIRGIYAFHVQSRGWCDIGYNFLVDRFGRVYEGRWGSLYGFRQGAQVGGFNSTTLGVSVLGDFTDVSFSSTITAAVSRVIAWQADRSAFDPAQWVSLVSYGSGRYPPGTKVVKPRVMGHRDLDTTSCPGDSAYPQVGAIRSAAASAWKAGQYTVTPSTFVPQTARRVLDTRAGTGAPKQAVGPNGTVTLSALGLPADATAVSLNVTVASASTPTVVAVRPAGVVRRSTATVYAWPGRPTATAVTVGLGSGSAVELTNVGGQVELVADVTGYWSRIQGGTRYIAIGTPTYLLDTRVGKGAPDQPVTPGSPVTFTVPGLPADARAVVLRVIGVGADKPTWLTAYQGGRPVPAASSVNISDATPTTNLVTVPIDSTGRVSISTAAGSVDVVAGLEGYYSTTRGSRFVPLSPRRVMDSRFGFATDADPFGAGEARTFWIAGLASTPTGAALTLSSSLSTSTGWGIVYRSGQVPPQVSTVSTTPSRSVTSFAQIPSATGGLMNVYNERGSTELVADMTGYFTP